MKNRLLMIALLIAFVSPSCNTQKSVDPTGQTPIPIGTDKTVNPDTTSNDSSGKQSEKVDSIPDTLMKGNN